MGIPKGPKTETNQNLAWKFQSWCDTCKMNAIHWGQWHFVTKDHDPPSYIACLGQHELLARRAPHNASGAATRIARVSARIMKISRRSWIFSIFGPLGFRRAFRIFFIFFCSGRGKGEPEAKKRQKTLRKHSFGRSEPGAQKHSKSSPGGTFRPGPLSTPVNGGWDRNP